jgi:hypothetical protein
MNEHLWWYLSRASGIVALTLLVISLVWGVLLSTRALRGVDRPAWLLATHTWLSGTAVVMTALHLLGLTLDGSTLASLICSCLVPLPGKGQHAPPRSAPPSA